MKYFLFKISTKLKDEIKDPEGELAEKIASRLKIFDDINIKKGKFFEIKVKSESIGKAKEKIIELIENILINPIVETYSIESFEELNAKN